MKNCLVVYERYHKYNQLQGEWKLQKSYFFSKEEATEWITQANENHNIRNIEGPFNLIRKNKISKKPQKKQVRPDSRIGKSGERALMFHDLLPLQHKSITSGVWYVKCRGCGVVTKSKRKTDSYICSWCYDNMVSTPENEFSSITVLKSEIIISISERLKEIK